MKTKEALEKHPVGMGMFAPSTQPLNEDMDVFEEISDAVAAGFKDLQRVEVLPGKSRPVPHMNGVCLNRYERGLLYEALKKYGPRP